MLKIGEINWIVRHQLDFYWIMSLFRILSSKNSFLNTGWISLRRRSKLVREFARYFTLLSFWILGDCKLLQIKVKLRLLGSLWLFNYSFTWNFVSFSLQIEMNKCFLVLGRHEMFRFHLVGHLLVHPLRHFLSVIIIRNSWVLLSLVYSFRLLNVRLRLKREVFARSIFIL